jgi:hypothetical protein
MRSLVIASILVAMTVPALAQSTRTTDPDSTMTETQKGGPASKESKPNAGGQQNVTKGAGPTNASPKAGGTSAPK